jgi:hypothetical protein
MQPVSKMPRPLRCGLIILVALSVLAAPAQANDEKSTKGFRDAIVALAPSVDPAEAELVSVTAHQTARRLQKEWRVVPFAIFQNFLIHIGARDRGYCFHWAHGIGIELRKLPLKTLVLHWGEAYPGTRLEHNVVVVTAQEKPFESGYIIDGWRAAGRLLWWPVAKDEYPWKENFLVTSWLQNKGPDPIKLEQATAVGKSQAPARVGGGAGSLE